MQTPRDLAESFAVLAVLFLVGLLAHWLSPNLSSAAGRLMQPWRFVPSVGSVTILEVTPGDTDVLLGESLEITARIAAPAGPPPAATLFFREEHGKETDVPMVPVEPVAEVRRPAAAGELHADDSHGHAALLPAGDR